MHTRCEFIPCGDIASKTSIPHVCFSTIYLVLHAVYLQKQGQRAYVKDATDRASMSDDEFQEFLYGRKFQAL